LNNLLQQTVDQHELTRQLVAHALLVRSDRPTYDEDGELLGHWQDTEWIKRLTEIAQKLAEIEKSKWVKVSQKTPDVTRNKTA
jgi:hypothetical protein